MRKWESLQSSLRKRWTSNIREMHMRTVNAMTSNHSAIEAGLEYQSPMPKPSKPLLDRRLAWEHTKAFKNPRTMPAKKDMWFEAQTTMDVAISLSAATKPPPDHDCSSVSHTAHSIRDGRWTSKVKLKGLVRSCTSTSAPSSVNKSMWSTASTSTPSLRNSRGKPSCPPNSPSKFDSACTATKIKASTGEPTTASTSSRMEAGSVTDAAPSTCTSHDPMVCSSSRVIDTATAAPPAKSRRMDVTSAPPARSAERASAPRAASTASH
mmetsp:Transcript_47512/g.112958  ORF Transcript_47512/g.112958 Transcript_47512/m.112958 type:complete len:266 (-) Transcript_47512:541-1338(-)